MRREHPHLKLVVVEDGLASNGPHIKHLKALDLRFIVGAKRSDHKALFEWVEATERVSPGAVKHLEHTDEHGVHHRLRYLDDVPLNDTHFALEGTSWSTGRLGPMAGSSTSRGSPTCPSTTPT